MSAPALAPRSACPAPLRAGRALVGFDEDGTGPQCAAVAARAPIEPEPAVDPYVPDALAAHVRRLAPTEPAASLLASGWVPRIVDLTQVIAARRTVRADPDPRVDALCRDDIAALAAVTLPLPADDRLPISYDARRNAFVIASPNTNLRVTGPAAGLGFTVAIEASLMQVALAGDRAVLRDGYHRAVALLARGITRVPALVRRADVVDGAELPANVLLGDRPPLLPDYLNDAVAADVELPATQKVIVIQAIELTT
jgi:hypothetical protein